MIEFFIANPDGSGYGEGETWLFTDSEGSGSDLDPDAGEFFFQVPVPGGVSVGTEITATATSGTGDTSEFSLNETVVATGQITGIVFEDVAGNVLDGGEAIGDLNNPTINGVSIRLYNDDGATANQPDATDTLFAGPITTAGAGAYSFSGVPAGNYWVVVDSRTVSPAAGVNASYLATTPWAEHDGPTGGR